MAHRIRRRSMEQLELYDLDELTRVPSNNELPIPSPRAPPIPPPRQNRRQILRNPSLDHHYKFLCDSTRWEKDPVYAATPMFTTIPHSKHVKYQHNLLGCHFPTNIITPLSTESPKSGEPSSAGPDKEEQEEEKEEKQTEVDNDDDDDEEGSDEDDDQSSGEDDDDISGSSSSSSSTSEDNDDDIFDNDDKKGVVQQIFDRHKKK